MVIHFIFRFNRQEFEYCPSIPIGASLVVQTWEQKFLTQFESEKIKVGSWIRIRNGKSNIYNGNLEAKLLNNSYVFPLNESDPEVEQAKKFYSIRLQNYIRERKEELDQLKLASCMYS